MAIPQQNLCVFAYRDTIGYQLIWILLIKIQVTNR